MILTYAANAAFCGLWAFMLIYMYRATVGMPVLHEETGALGGDAAAWPLVSVIVPACNEADHIEPALRSLLAQDYPRFELIVVDDRSTDGTGEIADRLAAADPRVRAVHIESLPDGWLGKVNALEQGTRRASGDWLLFTDADVHFAPGALRRGMAYAIRHDLDHLTLVPETTGFAGFLLDVSIRTFSMMLCASARVAEVNREGSRAFIGIGAFNLVQAAALKRTPGFEWLRMEPIDDMGLGAMLKASGARTHVVNGVDELSVPWYESVGAMIRGLEKNTFGAGTDFSYARQLLYVVMLVLIAIVPALSLLDGLYRGDILLICFGGIALAANLFVALRMPRRSVRDVAVYLCLPLGVALIAWIMLRAAYKCLRNGGVDWRGTHYPIEALRRGQRVRFRHL